MTPEAGIGATDGRYTIDLGLAGELLDLLPDGIVIVDSRGRIVLANRRLRLLTGFEAAELIGEHVEVLVPDASRDRHRTQREAYQQAPTDRGMGANLNITVRRKNGTEFPADIALKPVQTSDGPGVLAAVRDISERRAQEMLVKQSEARLALTEERERIGRELHDGTIQVLFGLGMNLQAAAGTIDDPTAKERVEAAVGQLDRVIADLRSYLFELKPRTLAGRSLEHAVADLAASIEADSGVAIAVRVDERAADRLRGHESTVLQLLRESLSNVTRHAQASTCRVDIVLRQGDVVIEIDDDGQGFDVAAARGTGHGLENLQRRAEALGGGLEISSGRDGTSLQVVIQAPEK